MNLSDTFVSLIRTWVPIGVGAAAVWLATTLGVAIDSETATGAAVALATGVYYSAARWAENRWPKAGWLLGVPKAPTYGSTN